MPGESTLTNSNSSPLQAVRLGPELVKFALNGIKSKTFSDQISVHFCHRAKMYWNRIWKSSGFYPEGKNVPVLKSDLKKSWILSHLTNFVSKCVHRAPRDQRMISCWWTFVYICRYSKTTWRLLLYAKGVNIDTGYLPIALFISDDGDLFISLNSRPWDSYQYRHICPVYDATPELLTCMWDTWSSAKNCECEPCFIASSLSHNN